MSNGLKKQRVSLVVPTYDGLKLLKKNLSAHLACLHDGDQIIIADDCSRDETEKWLKSKYDLAGPVNLEDQWGKFQKIEKDIQIIQKNFHFVYLKNLSNLRFARNCNRAVEQSRYPLILLLNNDVVPQTDILEYLLPHFKQKDIFAVSCYEQEPNLGEIGGKNKLWFEHGLFHHSRADKYCSGPTAWASGGSAMFNRKKWLQLNGFDPRFSPAYWEDIDLSFRAKKHGWKIWFEEKAKVIHDHESTNQDAFGKIRIMEMSWQNADTFTWKNGSFWQKLLFLFFRPYWLYQRKKALENL